MFKFCTCSFFYQDKLQAASYPRDLHPTNFFSTGLCSGDTIVGIQFSSWGEIEDKKKGTFSLYFEEGCSVVSPLLCPQYISEAVIFKHVQETATKVSLCFGWQVKSFTQDEAGVQVKAVNEDGKEEVFKAQYMVGCDGGASFVRKELDLHMFGKFVLARACTIFFNSPELVDAVVTKGFPGLGVVINPKAVAFTAMLHMNGDYVVHIFKHPDTSDEEMEEMARNPGRFLDEVLGCSGFPYKIIDSSSYNMHGLVTNRFNVGRCFLAGDSAHQWLPAGGLGLNSGISDVVDLAWKLEALVKGHGGMHLVESYESERRPLDDSTRHFAMVAAGGLAMVGTFPYRLVASLIKNSALVRRIIQPIFGKLVRVSLQSGINVVLGFQYSSSPIVVHRCDKNGSVVLKGPGTKSSLPGCRAPHVVLPDCSSILDLFGKVFVLLVIGGQADSHLGDLKASLQQRNVPFEVYGYPRLPQLVETYDRKFFMIRPDGVIAWSSDYQPSAAESNKIVSIALGHEVFARLPPQITRYDSSQWNLSAFFGHHLVRRYAVVGLLMLDFKLTLPQALLATGLALNVIGAITVRPLPEYREKTSRHKAVVIDKYGSAVASVMRLEPKYMGSFGPGDVLIQVYGASVNELDIQMRNGYASHSNQKSFRCRSTGSPYFPLVLGRDCSGRVVAVGEKVVRFLPGDLVYAVVPSDRPGSHAQLVAVEENCVAFKPTNVDHKEAASLPWVAMIAWSAIIEQAGLSQHNARGKKVLIHNGTCGVSSFAVQLLKSWGTHVTVTCSTEDIPLARRLGADEIIDKSEKDCLSSLRGLDVVLDPIGGSNESPSLSALKWFQKACYVNINSPQQYLVDRLGGLFGSFAFAWLYRFKVIFNSLFKGKRFCYVDATTNGECLDEVRRLVEQGAIRPVVDAVYSLDEAVAAHKHVETGQTRGKVILTT